MLRENGDRQSSDASLVEQVVRGDGSCRKIRAYYCAYLPRNTPRPNAHSGPMYKPPVRGLQVDFAFLLAAKNWAAMSQYSAGCFVVFVILCICFYAPGSSQSHPIALTCPAACLCHWSLLSNTSFLKRFLSAKCFYGPYDCEASVCVCVCECISLCV